MSDTNMAPEAPDIPEIRPYPPNVTVVKHPLLDHKIGLLRDQRTGTKDFRQLVDEVTQILFYSATHHLTTKPQTITTPICEAEAEFLAGPVPVLVPILRAGFGMLNSALRQIPEAQVGVIGLYRNEDAMPVKYYSKLPKHPEGKAVFILDPMLATGGSANAAIDIVKEKGYKGICFVNIISARPGLEIVYEQHPDVRIYTAAVDEKLNDHNYIVPGLGDAGDRIFGTK